MQRPDRGWAGAPESGCGAVAAVHRRVGVLPRIGQGASEVRDAALASGRGHAGDRGGGGAWLFAGPRSTWSRRRSRSSGWPRLLDERRGRRRPVKLRPEVVEFIRSEPGSSAGQLAEQVAERFRVRLPAHHRASPQAVTVRSFWPPAGGTGPTTKHCARTCSNIAGCPTGWPRRSPGGGCRVDRVASGAGLRGRSRRSRTPGVDAAGGSAGNRLGRRLPIPARCRGAQPIGVPVLGRGSR